LALQRSEISIASDGLYFSLASEKAFCAENFKIFWDEARQHLSYLKLKKAFKTKHKHS
jgi:hypothetical protein